MTGAQDWRGRVGETWAAEYRRTERAFSAIAQALDLTVAQHAPDKGRAVDIGCGAGSTAIALARARPDMTVTGIDLSVPLLSVAQSRADGIPRLQFVAGDARELLPSMAPLDLLVSRHGVMFFDDPVAGFADMARAARGGAPLVFSCFRSRIENDWSGAVDRVLGQAAPADGHAPGPYALADRERTYRILHDAGWHRIAATPHDVRYFVGEGDDAVEDALAFYRRIGSAAAILAAVDGGERRRLEDALRDMLAARICGGAIAFTAAIWIWTATAAGERMA
ncbi:MAG: class I SAM-dependent methyltransferase [Pseudomonadota bacterium]|nr:class I SAM-dependent methyltransferase [Pseudomonadota bacterium]